MRIKQHQVTSVNMGEPVLMCFKRIKMDYLELFEYYLSFKSYTIYVILIMTTFIISEILKYIKPKQYIMINIIALIIIIVISVKTPFITCACNKGIGLIELHEIMITLTISLQAVILISNFIFNYFLHREKMMNKSDIKMKCPQCSNEFPLTWKLYFKAPFGRFTCPLCQVKLIGKHRWFYFPLLIFGSGLLALPLSLLGGIQYGLTGALLGWILGYFIVAIPLDRFLEMKFSVLKVK
jgi:hypothetical protein